MLSRRITWWIIGVLLYLQGTRKFIADFKKDSNITYRELAHIPSSYFCEHVKMDCVSSEPAITSCFKLAVLSRSSD
jgi:hypothetical protein